MHEPVDITRDEIRRGRQYVECLNGSSWSRKIDAQNDEPIGEWPRRDPAATEPSSSTMSLCAVLEDQAPNEPRHWSLFCYRPSIVDGTGLGQVWQVTGDAEQMYYNHEPNTDKLSSKSFAWYQVLNGDLSDGQLAKIEEIVTTEPPPCAPNRALVTENCQGWVIRVLLRLEKEGIVKKADIKGLKDQMDPV